ncbi:MAG: hypothetical protein ACR2NU_07990, partial [Aeoliella sp.]
REPVVRREIARPEPVDLPSNLRRLDNFFTRPAKPRRIASVPPPEQVLEENPRPSVVKPAPLSQPKPIVRAEELAPAMEPAPIREIPPAPIVAIPERLAQPDGVVSSDASIPPRPILIPRKLAPSPKLSSTKVAPPRVTPESNPIVRKDHVEPLQGSAMPLAGVETRESSAPEARTNLDTDVVYPDEIGFPVEMLPSREAPIPNKLTPLVKSKPQPQPATPQLIDITKRDPVPQARIKQAQPMIARDEIQQPREFTAAASMQPLRPIPRPHAAAIPSALAQPNSLLLPHEVPTRRELIYPVGMSASQEQRADDERNDPDELTYPEEWIVEPGTYSADEIRFPDVIWPASYTNESLGLRQD